MSNTAIVHVPDPEALGKNGKPLRDVVEDFGVKVAQRLVEALDVVVVNEYVSEQAEQHNFGYLMILLYYQPRLCVKLAVIVFIVGVLLVLTSLVRVPSLKTALGAFWAVFGGLVILSITASTISTKFKKRRSEIESVLHYHLFRPIVHCTVKGIGGYLLVFLFAAFGICAIFVPNNDFRFVFLILFGLVGLSIVLLIGFQAWNKKIGLEPFIIVEAVFDIILTTRISSTSTQEMVFLLISGVLAGTAVLCAMLHVYLREAKETDKIKTANLQWLLSNSELVILIAFLTTDTADISLLTSQLLLMNANGNCNLDPKLLAVAALLALNPCVTELSAAFKSANEKLLSRDLHILQQEGSYLAEKDERILDKRAKLRAEQVRRRRMQLKSVLQTILIGLGAFPMFYLMAFLFYGQESWYVLLVPLLALGFYY